MTTLEKIRRNAPLMITVIAIALFAFIIGDGLRSCSPFMNQEKQVALSINGEKVKIQDYQARLKQMEQMAEQGGQKLTDQQRTMLNNQLTQEYITNQALKQIADKIGIKVLPSELFALIQGKGVQVSPIAAQFFAQMGINAGDPKAVNEVIKQLSSSNIDAMPAEQQAYMRSIQSQWTNAQEQIVVNRMQQKFAALMERSFVLNNVDVELEEGNSTRDVALVRTSTAMITDSTIKVSDADIQKYYDEHKEFFKTKLPITQVDFIQSKVVPSADDYQAAAQDKDKTIKELAESNNVENVLRNYTEKFYAKTYFTGAELDQMGLDPAVVEFIKSNPSGSVNSPELVNDNYNIVKVLGKKSGPADVKIRMIALDSTNMAKADSLALALGQANADFAEAAKKYSVDPESRENGGLLSSSNQYGIPQTQFSEAMLSQMGLSEIYEKPIGSIVRISRPNGVFLLKAEAPGANVDKYEFAYVSIPVNFSDKTYNEKYSQINNILIEGGSFADMKKKAEAAGLNVVTNALVTTESPQIGNIPNSREVVSWALKANDGAISDKLFRVGTDYLVIATVSKQIPAGMIPMELAKDRIKDQLLVEKRGEKLVKDLTAKGFTTLEEYAADLNVKVDSLAGVTYLVRGSEAPQFNGYAMTTPLDKLSAPFVAGTEVMVVKPVASKPNATPLTVKSPEVLQRLADMSRQMSYRAFNFIISEMDVQDNRARFY